MFKLPIGSDAVNGFFCVCVLANCQWAHMRVHSNGHRREKNVPLCVYVFVLFLRIYVGTCLRFGKKAVEGWGGEAAQNRVLWRSVLVALCSSRTNI